MTDNPLRSEVERVTRELRAYNPAADEYKGEHIHKVWARELEAALAAPAQEAVAWRVRYDNADPVYSTREPATNAIGYVEPLFTHPPSIACPWSSKTGVYFIAERTDRNLPNGIPIYETLDPVVPKGSLEATPPTPSGNSALVAKIVRDVAELPDRNSPEDWPEAMLVTGDELSDIVNRALAGQAQATQPQAQEVGRGADDRILWGVVANAGRLSDKRTFRWDHVMGATGLGSQSSIALCRRFGFDPDEQRGGNAQQENSDAQQR